MSSKEDTECSITTVYLYNWQRQWMREHGVNRSEFVRTALTNLIESENNFERRIKRLTEEKLDMERCLEEIDELMEDVRAQRHRSALAAETKRIEKKITREMVIAGNRKPRSLHDILAPEIELLTDEELWDIILRMTGETA